MDQRLMNPTYLKHGIVFDLAQSELTIDVSHPRKIHVIGVDALSGKTREYFLKVTERKGLVLV